MSFILNDTQNDITIIWRLSVNIIMIIIIFLVSIIYINHTDGFYLNTNLLLRRTHKASKMLQMSAADQERVVVTGLGVISPNGNTVTEFFDNLCDGNSGITKMERFDPEPFKCQIAGQVKDFNPRDYYKSKKKIKQNDLYTHYSVAATCQALEDAGIDLKSDTNQINAKRVGIIIGSAFGGMGSFEQAANDLKDYGPSSVGPYTIPMILGNTAAGIVAMETGAMGPNYAVQTACATATHAIGDGLRLLRNGDADIMICGGSEAALTPLSFAGFQNLMAMNFNYNDDPTKASRPFDLNRGGFVMSEGAGILVLETLSHAVKRGAKVYCELAGYGASCDAYHITSPHPEGAGLKAAMLDAIKDAALTSEQIDYINAHGTSTKKNDLFETIAYKETFGEHASKLKISSIKGCTGHSLGAAGGFEAIACVKTLETGKIAPTINYEIPDPECDLNYTPNKCVTDSSITTALSDNLGFGGHNGVIVFKKLD